jgi:hypothetical protein
MMLANLKQGSLKGVSRFDWTRPVAMSGDGAKVLFDESGEGGGRRYSVYLYSPLTDGFTRIGDGRAMDLSPDGKWAISQDVDDGSQLDLISTETRQMKVISGRGLIYRWARFMPGGKEILVSANYPGKPAGVYRQSLPDGVPTPVARVPDFTRPLIDETGNMLVGYIQAKLCRIDLATGAYQQLPLRQRASPVAILGPNRLLVRIPERGQLNLELLDTATGKLSPYRRVADPGASDDLAPVAISKNLQIAAYMRAIIQSELFVVRGWS